MTVRCGATTSFFAFEWKRGNQLMVAINSMDVNKILVSNFINSLSLPKPLAETLLLTSDDCQTFYVGYYGRNKYIVDDLLDYRDFKLENSVITIESFLNLCENGYSHIAFEIAFLQIFSKEEMRAFEKKVFEGTLTYESVYTAFKKDTNINILRLIS